MAILLRNRQEEVFSEIRRNSLYLSWYNDDGLIRPGYAYRLLDALFPKFRHFKISRELFLSTYIENAAMEANIRNLKQEERERVETAEIQRLRELNQMLINQNMILQN